MQNKSENDLTDIQHDVDKLRSETASHASFQNTGNVLNVITIVISDLLGGLFVGGIIGYGLCKYFDLHMIVFAVFGLLGGIAGLLNMYRSLKHLERKKTDHA